MQGCNAKGTGCKGQEGGHTPPTFPKQRHCSLPTPKNPSINHTHKSFMKKINFSQNWAGKLDCKEFTTIRLCTPSSFIQGDKVQVSLGKSKENSKPVLVGQIVGVRVCLITQLTEQDAKTDIGKPLAYLHGILQSMYKFKVFDWSTQLLVIYTIRVVYRYESTQLILKL